MDEEKSENVLVESVYRNVLGEFSHFKNKTTARVSYQHCLAVTPNLHANPGPPRIPLDSRFKYKVCLPKPFLPPTKVNPDCLKDGDPFTKILQDKEKWQNELDTLVRNAKRGKKWAEKQEHSLYVNKVKKKDAKELIYTVSSHVAVAKHVAADPYPYFSGKYNWLATGGCLSECTVNGEKYILHPTGKDMNFLRITSLDILGDEISASRRAPIRLPLAEGQRIYQIAGSNVGNRGVVAVRQEKSCSIVSLKEGLKRPINAKTVLEIQEKDGVFVSVDISHVEEKQFSTLDSDQILKLWDLNTSSCTGSAEITINGMEPNSRSWGFVKFSPRSDDLFVMNRKTLFVKDKRMPLSQNGLEFSPNPIIDDCEDLSLLLSSLNSPLVYVATNHHLLSLDLRFGWTQRWSHLMQQPPLYGSVYPGNGSDEVIILSSSLSDDSNAIVNKCQDGKSISETFPIGLPSTTDCLLRANVSGKCLGTTIKKRLQMATTGLILLWQDGNNGFMSLKSTSIGDVISQQFLPEVRLGEVNEVLRREKEYQAEIKLWEGWEKDNEKVCAKYIPDLRCPTYSNETPFNALKTCQVTNEKIMEWQSTFSKCKDVGKHCQFCAKDDDDSDFKKTLCDLGCYKDLMAGVLLKAWDTEGLTTKVESKKYVENWLKDTTAKSASFSGLLEEEEEEDYGFKVPVTPSKYPKRMKRESLGF